MQLIKINISMITCKPLILNLLINQTNILSYLHKSQIYFYGRTIVQPFYNIIIYTIYLLSIDQPLIIYKMQVVEISILVITFTLSAVNRSYYWTRILLFLHLFWTLLSAQTIVWYFLRIILNTIYWLSIDQYFEG